MFNKYWTIDSHHVLRLILFVRFTIDFITGTDPYTWKGYLLAGIFLVLNVSKSALNQVYIKFVFSTALRIRTSLTTAIYRKVYYTFLYSL